jgi:hypothetical protein
MPDAGGDGKSIRCWMMSFGFASGVAGREGAANAYKHASWMNENAADCKMYERVA